MDGEKSFTTTATTNVSLSTRVTEASPLRRDQKSIATAATAGTPERADRLIGSPMKIIIVTGSDSMAAKIRPLPIESLSKKYCLYVGLSHRRVQSVASNRGPRRLLLHSTAEKSVSCVANSIPQGIDGRRIAPSDFETIVAHCNVTKGLTSAFEKRNSEKWPKRMETLDQNLANQGTRV